MKKRNTLRALGVLVIFAVLGILSACENYKPYEFKDGGYLSLKDNETFAMGIPFDVKVFIPKKDDSEYIVEWILSGETDPTITVKRKIVINGKIEEEEFINKSPISEATTLTFTVTGNSDEYELYIEVSRIVYSPEGEAEFKKIDDRTVIITPKPEP